MKTYNVVWTERFSVNVEAENETEAEQMIHDGEYDEAGVASTLDSVPEAYVLTHV